jgi:hypothetical protein
MAVGIKEIKQRYSKAVKQRQQFESVLRDAYRYALPERGVFDTLSHGQRNFKLYDDTAVEGIGVYADKIQSNMTPAWKEWFKLVPGSEVDEVTAEEVQPLLDEIADKIYDNLNHSNFSSKINEAYQDVAISTGIITCEEGDGVESFLNFNSIPIEDIAIEETQTGIIENIYKKFIIRIDEIEEIIRGSRLHPRMIEMQTADPTATVELIEAVVKNENRKFDHVVYWEAENDWEVFRANDDDTSPYVVFRESVPTKSIYGTGRIIKKLRTIKVLNEIKRMDLTNAEFSISGAWTAVDDGVINPYTAVMEPGTVIPVASNATANPSLRPLDRPGDFQLAQLQIQQLQDEINKVLLNQPLGEVSRTPVRTATEVGVRTQENIEVTSAAFSRFQTELLERLIKRIVDVLQQAGQIAPIVVDGKEITIKFTSPLAKQQDLKDIETIVNYSTILQATGIPLETLGSKIKFEEVPQFVARQMGLPSELIRTPEEENVYNQQQLKEAQASLAAEGETNE